jgi:hypothetical protein
MGPYRCSVRFFVSYFSKEYQQILQLGMDNRRHTAELIRTCRAAGDKVLRVRERMFSGRMVDRFVSNTCFERGLI